MCGEFMKLYEPLKAGRQFYNNYAYQVTSQRLSVALFQLQSAQTNKLAYCFPISSKGWRILVLKPYSM